MEKIDILSLNLAELENVFSCKYNTKKFVALQVFEWLHRKNAEAFSKMTSISKKLADNLNSDFFIMNAEIMKKQVSKEDGTEKFLFKLTSGAIVESVFMRYEHGNTVCISSQEGCRMGCSFCASSIGGLIKNLAPSEILAQVYAASRSSGRVGNIVIMGSGEPFDNYDNVIKFIRILNFPQGQNIGQRHITLSTCGLVPEIKKFAAEKFQSTLAVSLHAPNDTVRRRTMPVAYKYSMDELLEACREYSALTGRRVTYEYALIKNLNDGAHDALELAARLSGSLCHVNLIPVNEVKEHNFEKSEKKQIENFSRILSKSGIPVTIRRKLGSDINASCGQLRNRMD